MMDRERQLGYRTPARPGGLVVPVSVHDGEKFPQFARSIQYLNWARYALVGEGFKKTEVYAESQGQVKVFADGVARAVENAPQWDQNWADDGWLNQNIPAWLRKMNEEGGGGIMDFPPPSMV